MLIMPNSWTVSEKVFIGNERIQESNQLGNSQRSRWGIAQDDRVAFQPQQPVPLGFYSSAYYLPEQRDGQLDYRRFT